MLRWNKSWHALSLAPSLKKENQKLIYVICAGNALKIGWTTGNPKSRLDALQTGNAQKLGLAAMWDGTRDEERALHRRFAQWRIQGEWFLPSDELVEFVKSKQSWCGLAGWEVNTAA
jgi:hypothetical protein